MVLKAAALEDEWDCGEDEILDEIKDLIKFRLVVAWELAKLAETVEPSLERKASGV